ncbi:MULTISPECIES: GreA/GreB family elongation factor [unclassified Anaeromyxobacter]|uniref:GreA/GreB family elongation factor n=1 Tax=unclassified Anaeromyxobacter TaxID=2620896 RepID=UPI001F564DEE|nr:MULTISPECIES: GreA/GreB family elongation factor [unclassified Anaeromyxobacter]
MSKAFTSEETPDLGPVVRAPPRVAPGEVRYVTPEGQAALRQELERLREARADAAALPEHARAARHAELDRRAALVEGTLAALTVLGPESAPEGRVGFGTWVLVEDEEGRTHSWRIVGPDEADARRGLVSVSSPVAQALLGHEAGDTVEVDLPAGVREFTVLEVRRRS